MSTPQTFAKLCLSRARNRYVLGVQTSHQLHRRSFSNTTYPEAQFASPGITEQYVSQVHQSELQLPGRNMSFEVGKIAQLADSSIVARDGDTTILTTVVSVRDASKSNSGMLPITVDFREKAFAAGFIPSNTQRREAAPREREVLCGRAIDRSIRPLFPENFTNETQVVSTVFSLDPVGDFEVLALNSASMALSIAPQVPWDGPFGAVRVGYFNGEFMVNPSRYEMENGLDPSRGGGESSLDLLYVGTRDKVLMIEAGANEVPKEDFTKALEVAHEAVQEVIEFQTKFQKQLAVRETRIDASQLRRAVEDCYIRFGDQARKLYDHNPRNGPPPSKEKILHGEKRLMQQIFSSIKSNPRSVFQSLAGKVPDEVLTMAFCRRLLEAKDLKSVRPDGRGPEDIRSIDISTNVLPVVHGSALFKRGSTQCLSTVTLGTTDDCEKVHPYAGEVSRKHFLLHYNFPPFSVNEVGRTGSVNRRMIGHGALAEKAIAPVMPSRTEFPYTVRVTSETMSSDGSSSMATVCGTSLALADAGVPIRKPVAGISVGVVLEDAVAQEGGAYIPDPQEKTQRYILLTDITGQEDHRGHMDFKLAGTADGVTAVQLDVKCNGIPISVLAEAVDQAWAAKAQILNQMKQEQPQVRQPLKSNVPLAKVVEVPRHKVKHLLGPRGEHLEKLKEATGADITIDKELLLEKSDCQEENKVSSNVADLSSPSQKIAAVVYHTDVEQIEKAESMIQDMITELVPGTVYSAVVKDVREFGAFVTLDGEHDAYLHISEVSETEFENITNVLQVGDTFEVLCLSSDERGIKVSKKAAVKHRSIRPIQEEQPVKFRKATLAELYQIVDEVVTEESIAKARAEASTEIETEKTVKYKRRVPRQAEKVSNENETPSKPKGLVDRIFGVFNSSSSK